MSSSTFRTALAILAILSIGLPYPAPAKAIDNTTGPEQVRGRQWHLRYLNVASAHRICRGEGVVVAIEDTRIYDHPDLAGDILSGVDLVGDNGNTRQEPSSQGTLMAGLIAAHGQRGNTGALGIAPEAKVLHVRVQPDAQQGSTETPRSRH